MSATTGTTGRAAAPAGSGGETAPPALPPQRMQAIVQDAYGAADVWRVEQIARPEIAGNEVLVKVHAAGLDRGTWHEGRREVPVMGEDRLHVVTGTGQVGSALAGQGIAVRAVCRHRPPALVGVDWRPLPIPRRKS